ncbi:MAG: UvrB/UvrC motif-containing protein, partial [Clostridia bacterium]|nr:UvrB/UvrC motif-containing protein [Clostridia bacterium]
TMRRRKIQIEFNQRNNITPASIIKQVRDRIETVVKDEGENYGPDGIRNIKNIGSEIKRLEMLMEKSAAHLEFEAAARYRDEIKKLRKLKSGGM